jgi:tight adherence protein C
VTAILAPLLVAASGACAVAAASGRAASRMLERLPGRAGLADVPGADPLARLRVGLERMGGIPLPWATVDRGSLARRLRAAGLSVTVSQAIGARRAAAAIGLLAGLCVPGYGAALGPLTAAIGFAGPGLMLSRRASRRSARMDEELPQLLDLLATASYAGLAGPLALRRAVEATTGPLAEELRAVVDAVDLGARWRDELRACAERLEVADLHRAVAALTRTETLGTSLSDATADVASRVREARRAAATERARKAPVKMLFPLVFLVLPAFLLLTVVPVLFSTVQSIR